MLVMSRACRLMSILALAGTLACSTVPELTVERQGRLDDQLWVALSRGDVEVAERTVAGMTDADLAERGRLDVLAAREGRAAALVTALDRGTWLAARYRAGSQQAEDDLRRAAHAGVGGAALALEQARRAAPVGDRLDLSRAAQSDPTAAAEARAIEVETLLSANRLSEAARRMPAQPPTARLALLRRRLDHAAQRYAAVVTGVCEDLRDGWAVPYSLVLLEDALRGQPSRALEQQVADALDGVSLAGAPMLRSRERLLAVLEARAGRLAAAAARLQTFAPRQPEEDEALRRWTRRLDPSAADTIEERLDADRQRLAGRDLFLKRLGDEWDLEARASYREAAQGASLDLDDFLGRLDAASAPLPGRPELQSLPRRDFGLFGALVDTDPLRTVLPDAVLVGGEALLMAPELTWFDQVACEEVELPEALGHYAQCTVRRTRVSGRLASQGVNIAGAGLDRLVWLDLDELEREERSTRVPPRTRALGALPAANREERLSLGEPLDMVERLTRQSRDEAGPDYPARLLETIALHEGQHIIDFQQFVAQGTAGRLWTLLGAGLLPGAVRVEIERRAHLRALRDARDPRIALAQAVSRLPVEGEAFGDEHAVAYAALVGELVERLDQPRLPDGRRPEEAGIDHGRVLLQQLDRLPPETLRSLARALPD